MFEVSDDEFQAMINQALSSLPGEHARNIENVAILYQYEPTLEQRQKLLLRNDQTLLGLYDGIPLTQRQGMSTTFPDRITLFKGPLTRMSRNEQDLKEAIRHTLWHEIGHYYGLNHQQIRKLEN